MKVRTDQDRLPNYYFPHLYFFDFDFLKTQTKLLLSGLKDRDIVVLENIRFYSQEIKNDGKFSKELSSWGDFYVNDNFAASTRNHASITGLPKLLPHAAGLQLEKEVGTLSQILAKPQRPYVLMVGGIKLKSKINAIWDLLEKVDYALVGGGVAALFLKCQGYYIGKSKIEVEALAIAKELLRNYKDKIVLPVDLVVANSPDQPESLRVSKVEKILAREMILDVGPQTIQTFSQVLKTAKTLVWSGPLGLFEKPAFSHGTKSLGRLFASRSSGLATGVAGGGNTLQAIKLIKMHEYFDFLSTGGSAMLEYLAGKRLPGIEILKTKVL